MYRTHSGGGTSNGRMALMSALFNIGICEASTRSMNARGCFQSE
jgi:hypothetical protein